MKKQSFYEFQNEKFNFRKSFNILPLTPLLRRFTWQITEVSEPFNFTVRTLCHGPVSQQHNTF